MTVRNQSIPDELIDYFPNMEWLPDPDYPSAPGEESEEHNKARAFVRAAQRQFLYSLFLFSFLSFLLKSSSHFAELATHVTALKNAMQSSHRTEDRDRYRNHLATAAMIFESLEQREYASAKSLVEQERKASFFEHPLDGGSGTAAKAAFSRLANSINRI